MVSLEEATKLKDWGVVITAERKGDGANLFPLMYNPNKSNGFVKSDILARYENLSWFEAKTLSNMAYDWSAMNDRELKEIPSFIEMLEREFSLNSIESEIRQKNAA